MPKFVERAGFADGKTNDYYNNKNLVGSTGYYSGRENVYQCVNYAVARSQEIAEKKCTYYGSETSSVCEKPMFNRKGYGNASEWSKSTLWEFDTDNVRIGDVVVYGSGWGNGCGHVRIVERIEGNYMYLSGANEDNRGTVKFGIKQPIVKGGGKNATGLQGYIHNPFLSNEDKKEEIDYKLLYEQALNKLEQIEKIIKG